MSWKWIACYVVLSDWLHSLSIVSSRLIRIIASISPSFRFIAKYYCQRSDMISIISAYQMVRTVIKNSKTYLLTVFTGRHSRHRDFHSVGRISRYKIRFPEQSMFSLCNLSSRSHLFAVISRDVATLGWRLYAGRPKRFGKGEFGAKPTDRSVCKWKSLEGRKCRKGNYRATAVTAFVGLAGLVEFLSLGCQSPLRHRHGTDA